MPAQRNFHRILEYRVPEAAVQHFFDPITSTLTYVVSDPSSRCCVVIDPVLDLDYASGTITTGSADKVIAYINDEALSLTLILETHIHADHLSSAPYLQRQLGGRIGIGSHIPTIQATFAEIFDEDERFRRDGSQFDLILADGDHFDFGALTGEAYHVPGHTPACMAYRIGNALFVGDTLFMPDAGTARCDFPGGDARALYDSCQRLLALPDDTRVYVCHDYQPDGRALAFVSTIAQQRDGNIHVGDNITADEFVTMREARDATLDMPTLILPSLQTNMRAGHLPPGNIGGRLFLKVPVNAFAGADMREFVAKE
jgi:glyoxylase-like metal-dependent hydrolase (beta-lactamase superfamily II)